MKKNQREEEHEVPGILDQFDQKILGLWYETKQHKADGEGTDGNANNPKDEGEIDHIAPGARDVTAYHGPKAPLAINYLLPGPWDVGVAKSVSHIRPPNPRPTNGDQRVTRRRDQRLRTQSY
jgi:hypothetical protein